MCSLNQTAADIDNLKVIPSLSSISVQHGLKQELPKYVAAAEGISSNTNKLNWWKSHESDLPNRSSACKVSLLIQPSSATAEQVSSLLSNSFGDIQSSSMEDYVETSVLLQYNSYLFSTTFCESS